VHPSNIRRVYMDGRRITTPQQRKDIYTYYIDGERTNNLPWHLALVSPDGSIVVNVIPDYKKTAHELAGILPSFSKPSIAAQQSKILSGAAQIMSSIPGDMKSKVAASVVDKFAPGYVDTVKVGSSAWQMIGAPATGAVWEHH
jgi:hypothetical protein